MDYNMFCVFIQFGHNTAKFYYLGTGPDYGHDF